MAYLWHEPLYEGRIDGEKIRFTGGYSKQLALRKNTDMVE